MIDHRGFSAWITSDNMQLVEFEPRVDEKTHTVTCWIAGPVGKPFVVHWRDHGSRVDSASYISVDGYKVPGQFLYGHGEQLRRGVRVGSREERPFVFSKIEAGDSIGYGALKPHKNVGSIMLEIRQVRRTKPYGLLELSEPPSVIRGQRPEGEICVRYGEARTIPAQPPTWHISPYDPSSRDPFVTFIFRYRTHDWLISQCIIGPDEAISQEAPIPWPLESPAHLLTPSSEQPTKPTEPEAQSDDEPDEDSDPERSPSPESGYPTPGSAYPTPVSAHPTPVHTPTLGLGLLGIGHRPEASRHASDTSQRSFSGTWDPSSTAGAYSEIVFEEYRPEDRDSLADYYK